MWIFYFVEILNFIYSILLRDICMLLDVWCATCICMYDNCIYQIFMANNNLRSFYQLILFPFSGLTSISHTKIKE